MKLSSADRKIKARKLSLEEMELQEAEGLAYCILGLMNKYGRIEVLKSKMGEELYWLKEQYEDFIKRSHEVRVRKIPLKNEGNALINQVVQLYIPKKADDETDYRRLVAASGAAGVISQPPGV